MPLSQPYIQTRCVSQHTRDTWSKHGTLALSKNAKNASQDTRKWFHRPSKSIPRDHSRDKKRSNTARDHKNMNLGGRSPHHAGQKTPKWDLQKKPRRPKMEYLYGEAENLNFGCSSKPSRSTFLKQNQPLFRTVGKTYRTVTSPLIFEGCTIRFACFGNPRPPGLALRNTP